MAKSKSANNTANKRANAAPAKRAVSPAEKNMKRKLGAQEIQRASLIDDRAKRTIVALVCVLCAVALMLVIALPSDAVVTAFLSEALHKGLGLGAYLLPLLVIAAGVAYRTSFDSQRSFPRIVLGLCLVYLGMLILFALLTPGGLGVDGSGSNLFSNRNVVTHGGYVGAGPAYVGLMLLGLPVSVIIALGLVAVGVVVIGFSLRRALGRALARRRAAQAKEEQEWAAAPAMPYAPLPEMAPDQAMHSWEAGAPATQLMADAPLPPIEAAPERPSMPLPAPRPADALSQSLGGPRRSTRRAPGATVAMTRRLGAMREDVPVASSEPARPAKAAVKKSARPVAAVADSTKSPDDTFVLPDRALLNVGKARVKTKAFEEELRQTATHLQQTIESFGIAAQVVDWIAGPTVTLYEVDLPPGVRVSRLLALKDDIALALAAPGVRIFAPIPKTHYVGIEVPNATRENVLLGDILKSVKGGPLEVAIGKDVEGRPIVEDLARMPHLLIGGTTGSGKSVGINAMIMSILMRATPSQVRFIMIDPKRVEFAPYDGIPHLYVPVVTEPKEAASALSWGVAEMDLRLKTFEGAKVRNISTYNAAVLDGSLRARIDSGDILEGKIKHPQFIDEPMPYIVIVIDELADLMMNVGKEVEFSISRIAQLARAAGIHLIVATQRPSANVVTGLIKANITTRIAYNVASGLDSRVILDTAGAESLIGLGDLLISKPQLGRPLRVQGCFTSDEEIAQVVAFLKTQGQPEYHSEILKTNLITLGDSAPDGSGGSGGNDDPLVWEAAEIVVSCGLGSTSNIQRKLKVGYARAGRIMDMLEEKGVVGPANGSKPREVLVDALELETLKAFEAADGQTEE